MGLFDFFKSNKDEFVEETNPLELERLRQIERKKQELFKRIENETHRTVRRDYLNSQSSSYLTLDIEAISPGSEEFFKRTDVSIESLCKSASEEGARQAGLSKATVRVEADKPWGRYELRVSIQW